MKRTEPIQGTYEERKAIYMEELSDIRQELTDEFKLEHPEYPEVCASNLCNDDCPMHPTCEQSEAESVEKLSYIYGADVVADEKEERIARSHREADEEANRMFAEFMERITGKLTVAADEMNDLGDKASDGMEAIRRFEAIAEDMKKCAECSQRGCAHHPEYDPSFEEDDDDEQITVVGIDELADILAAEDEGE